MASKAPSNLTIPGFAVCAAADPAPTAITTDAVINSESFFIVHSPQGKRVARREFFAAR
jgi:hypothetical protein